MLRLILLILVLVNAAYFAWGQGWLLPYSMGPAQQREPQRLTQQVRPEAMDLVTDKDVPPTVAMAPAANSLLCLQSGLLDEAQASAVRRWLASSFAQDSWAIDIVKLPERWIVYMGKYANAAELAKKRTQLAGLRLSFEPLSNPALAPGLSLGAYASQEAANTALEALALRGVRTARVLLELPASQAYRVRLPAINEAMQKQLPQLKNALAGKPLDPCSAVAPP